MPFDIELSVNDGQGRTFRFGLHTTAADIATAQTAMTALLADLAPVVGMGWTRYAILVENAAVKAADLNSNKDEAARLRLSMTDGSTFNLRLPTPIRSGTTGQFIYVTNGVVDKTNVDLLAFLGNFETAGSFRLGYAGGRTLSPLPGGFLSGYLETK